MVIPVPPFPVVVDIVFTRTKRPTKTKYLEKKIITKDVNRCPVLSAVSSVGHVEFEHHLIRQRNCGGVPQAGGLKRTT
jgi:hypothetical protein